MTESGRNAFDLMYNKPAELGRRLGYTDLRDELHGEWMKKMLTASEDMTLQAHRGSYKTTCLCIVLAIIIATQPDIVTMFLRKTDNDVVQVIKQVTRIINHPFFQALTALIYADSERVPAEPLKIIKATSTEIICDNYAAPRGASQLLGVGIGGSLTGKHADLVVTDDIVNLTDRVSHAERERTKAVYQELQNIKNRTGRILNTGTPWHKEDAFCLMPEPIVFDCYHTGLITPEQLQKIRNSMDPSLFAANYELQHIAAENALFTSSPVFTDDPDFLRDGIAHIDAAYGGEDYTAFTCACRIKDKIYVYGRLWHSHVDTVLDAAIAEADRLLCAPIYCETNGDKGYLAREIKNRNYSTHVYTERENKFLKISTFLRKWWSNIVFLQGTDAEYINQIMDYNEQAEHDDAPDSCASIIRLLDRRGD